MELYLKEKIVLVTASSAGIGKSIAEVFLNEGAGVIINGRESLKLQQLVDLWGRKYPQQKIDFFAGDLTDNNNICALKDFVLSNYGKLDILISNLGNGQATYDNQLHNKEWERMLNVNLISTVGLLNEFIPVFKNQKSGSIVLVSSITGLERSKAPYAYAAAKSALLTLNKNLSVDLADYNIRINCVIPGNVYFPGGRWEEIIELNPESTSEYIEREVPLKRFAMPEEIAHSVVFLASERSSFTTGAALVIDGGQTRRY